MLGHDLYLRYNNGPVQCFRVWDSERFIQARVEDGEQAKRKGDKEKMFTVSTATREEYLAERKAAK